MKTHNARFLCLCTAASCLLALVGASPALADFDMEFEPGPDTMVLATFEFGQFHATMTNTGTIHDSYTLTVVENQPADWSFAVCYGGVCYPPQPSYTVPTTGTLAPGEEMLFDFDVSTFLDGAASYVVTIVSNNDPSVTVTKEYFAYTPSEPMAMEMSWGRTSLAGAGVDEFHAFHGMLYNAGLQPDSYHLSITRDIPENWTVSFCVNGLCYPPTLDDVIIPDVPSAGAVELDIDYTTFMDEGTGYVTLTIVSNSDGSIQASQDFIVTTLPTAVDDTPASVLVQNLRAVPNPFNPRSDIRFAVGGDATAPAVIDIFDASGRRVRSLHTGSLTPGDHSITWNGLTADGQPAAAGVYLASVRVNDEQHMVKMTLAK